MERVQHIWLVIREYDNSLLVFSSLTKACITMGWKYNSLKNIKAIDGKRTYKGFSIYKLRVNNNEVKFISDIL